MSSAPPILPPVANIVIPVSSFTVALDLSAIFNKAERSVIQVLLLPKVAETDMYSYHKNIYIKTSSVVAIAISPLAGFTEGRSADIGAVVNVKSLPSLDEYLVLFDLSLKLYCIWF